MHLSRSTPQRLVLLGALIASASACGSVMPVRVSRYLPNAPEKPNGAVYILPRALLRVDFRAKLTLRLAAECAVNSAKCARLELAASGVTLAQPELEAVPVPDLEAAYVIRSPGSFMVKTAFAAQISERGELTASSASATNQSMEFAAWGMETIAKTAKAVAAAGRTQEVDRRHEKAKRRAALELAIVKLDNRITKLASGTPEAISVQPQTGSTKKADAPSAEGQSSLGDVGVEIDRTLALKGKLQAEIAEIDGELVRTLDFPVSCLLDPSSKNTFTIAESGGDCQAYEGVKAALTAADVDMRAELPTLTVTLSAIGTSATTTVSPNTTKPTSTEATRNESETREISGFVYRIPAWFLVDIASDRMSKLQKIVAIPQRGQLAVLGLRDDDLRAGKTIEVSLHPSLGMLHQVKVNGEPINVDDAKKVTDATANLITLHEDAELARLTRETALIEAQKKYLEGRAALEKLKKETPTSKDVD